MRIAWFTPYGRGSAIGRASRLIVEELARSVEVDIWHPAAKQLHDAPVRTIAYPPEAPIDLLSLQAYDLAVYNLGNHLGNHRQIFEIALQTPGIDVLHDFVMHHFFVDYYLQHHKTPGEYIRSMERWYGKAGKSTAQASSGMQPSDPIWHTDNVVQYPLFEEAIRGAYAVVTHSDFLARKVQAVFQGPVRKLQLAYDVLGSERVPSRKGLDVPEDRVLIVTVGHVNPNKRVMAMIDALGHTDLASRVFYAVLGPVDPGHLAELSKAVRLFDLENTVRFLGAVPDDRLAAFLTHADIFVNLRFPTFEGASASAIEELLYGKPVVVTDTGWYRELPDDCVLKIRPEQESEDLVRCLKRLVADEPLRRRMGQAGKLYARETFRADRYAAGILELATEVLDAKPLLALADRIGHQMARMGTALEAPLVSSVAETSSALFGDS